MSKYKLAIVGSGALGSIIGEVVSKELSKEYEILGVLSGNIENALNLSNKLNCKAYNDLDEIILDRPDYIIEAASIDILKDIGISILQAGISLIPLSIGAFAHEEFFNIIKSTAEENNARVHIPSGAVGGFDVLRAAMLMEDAQVSITTEKAPESLNGAPFLKGRILSEDKIEDVFNGSAKEAIELFPNNVNVAVATALSTRGVDNTKTLIRSIPNLEYNKHEINLLGNTIKVSITIQSKPSEGNLKSSSLAAYSVVALLKNLASSITF